MRDLGQFLETVRVDDAVMHLRPDYRALLIAADGVADATTVSGSGEDLLRAAEKHAREAATKGAVEDLPHIAAWRDAYRAFGAKPQRTRNSVEALTRRAPDGLPRVNALTDVYNAISVRHQLPIGGEDLDGYVGAPHLVLAAGDEPFDTTANGNDVVEHPDRGEVVWRDDVGVTCRRWNWRQGRRTQLTDHTSAAFFILDALDPMTDAQLDAAGSELIDCLHQLGPDVRTARRLISRSHP